MKLNYILSILKE